MDLTNIVRWGLDAETQEPVFELQELVFELEDGSTLRMVANFTLEPSEPTPNADGA